MKSLEELEASEGPRRFDFAFVDADKPGYVDYYERLLRLIRPGGLIAADNTLVVAGSYVPRLESAIGRALRTFNDHVHHDERVDLSLVPIGEGLTLLRVR